MHTEFEQKTPMPSMFSHVKVPKEINKWIVKIIINKANLRDLIAATGLVISNMIQIVDFSACVTLKFDGRPQTRQIWGIW